MAVSFWKTKENAWKILQMTYMYERSILPIENSLYLKFILVHHLVSISVRVMQYPIKNSTGLIAQIRKWLAREDTALKQNRNVCSWNKIISNCWRHMPAVPGNGASLLWSLCVHVSSVEVHSIVFCDRSDCHSKVPLYSIQILLQTEAILLEESVGTHHPESMKFTLAILRM